jgi:hypothetical protein
MRAKFYVTEIIRVCTITRRGNGQEDKVEIHSETLKMSAVCPSKFGANGEHEDNDFHRWSPSGSFEIQISNPALFGKFEIGQ